MSRPTAAPADDEQTFDGGMEMTPESSEKLGRARPIPRISIQAFCEDDPTTDVRAGCGRRSPPVKTHVAIHMGGVNAAVAHYLESPTPNLIVIESTLPARGIDRLSSTSSPNAAMPAPR